MILFGRKIQEYNWILNFSRVFFLFFFFWATMFFCFFFTAPKLFLLLLYFCISGCFIPFGTLWRHWSQFSFSTNSFFYVFLCCLEQFREWAKKLFNPKNCFGGHTFFFFNSNFQANAHGFHTDKRPCLHWTRGFLFIFALCYHFPKVCIVCVFFVFFWHDICIGSKASSDWHRLFSAQILLPEPRFVAFLFSWDY